MSSFSLKLVAVITMLTDHIGLILFPDITVLNMIGRIAFPLFAFLIAEGFLKTGDVKKYLLRLLLFAFISTPPYFFAFKVAEVDNIGPNIFFTLTAGLLILIVLFKVRPIWFSVTLAAVIVYISEILRFEYGAYGIVLILACFLMLKRRVLGEIAVGVTNILGSFSALSSKIFSLQIFSLAAIPFMMLYNGKRGFTINKWWFYWFYPAHLFILAFIKFIT